jgi:1-acylglycerone phosphate reductase
MELRPLGVRVLLVAMGAVRSNLAVNADGGTAVVPPGSLYERFRANITGRLYDSQTVGTMPTADAARHIVDGALAPAPPRYLSFGGRSTLFWIFRWLPRALVLNLMWYMASKPRPAHA